MNHQGEHRIAVIGLGYVGLPLALGFAREFEGVIGFDINESKVGRLRAGEDPTDEGLEEEIKNSSLYCTASIEDTKPANVYIVGVPTPVDVHHRPDLSPLESACRLLSKVLSSGDIVVFESTVYPGVTEQVCGPLLEEGSGLQSGKDFFLGYSPERINPGDKEHTLEKIVKVVAGQNAEVSELLGNLYGKVVTAGIHIAPTIRVAEAAKVIENTQRDLNIALMNELAMIFDQVGISTSDVLAAAGTKWNFLPFRPGLVGGHCIGVDPYYLTTLAEQLGYHPQVILAGRRINDGMGRFVAQKTVKLLAQNGVQIRKARVGILGFTFKENVSDLRNSRVPDIYHELSDFGIEVQIHDPLADAQEAQEEYGIELFDLEALSGADALILAVAHRFYMEELGVKKVLRLPNPEGVVVDIKSVLPKGSIPSTLSYWAL